MFKVQDNFGNLFFSKSNDGVSLNSWIPKGLKLRDGRSTYINSCKTSLAKLERCFRTSVIGHEGKYV